MKTIYGLMASVSLFAIEAAYCMDTQLMNPQLVEELRTKVVTKDAEPMVKSSKHLWDNNQELLNELKSIPNKEYNEYAKSYKELHQKSAELEKSQKEEEELVNKVESTAPDKKKGIKGFLRKVTKHDQALIKQIEKLRVKIEKLSIAKVELEKSVKNFEEKHAPTYKKVDNLIQSLYPFYIKFGGKTIEPKKDRNSMLRNPNKIYTALRGVDEQINQKKAKSTKDFKKKFVARYGQLAKVFDFIPEISEVSAHIDKKNVKSGPQGLVPNLPAKMLDQQPIVERSEKATASAKKEIATNPADKVKDAIDKSAKPFAQAGFAEQLKAQEEKLKQANKEDKKDNILDVNGKPLPAEEKELIKNVISARSKDDIAASLKALQEYKDKTGTDLYTKANGNAQAIIATQRHILDLWDEDIPEEESMAPDL